MKTYFIRTWICSNKNGKSKRCKEEYNKVFYTKKQCKNFLRSEGFRSFGKIFRQKHSYEHKKGYFYEFARIDDKY